MAYTKKIARHDKVMIDAVDVSNSFREFGFSSEHSEEDVSGFSVSGVDEFLPGSTTQGFAGNAFYTEELAALVYPIHRDRDIVVISWQPDGLLDSTREIYTGNCTINTWNPSNTRGTAMTTPFSAKPADSTGITVADFT